MRPKGLNLRLLLVLPYMLLIATGSDVFCGNLTVFKQKWFSKDAQTLAAQKANDLKQCLDACCAIQVCNALTFMGFLGNSSSVPAANCVLFQCSDNCVAVDEHEAAEGVISVQIKRKPEVISQKNKSNQYGQKS
ncbi:unnamed protein product [Bursaphelenchus okinawaensis]|uniref:Apple domain-containing protein n=1 Tax=Bursaphelenchus okinawaensis TaxID=465554 RepID=A0A811JSJ0_9BILA|nr:unnamed protein product [Bursaphelenchus okinawaensis]CAG9081242.1 unnamed protein product [Bursaphelenchus okinawaensis]